MDVHRSQQKYQRSFTYIWKSPLAEEDKQSIETFLKDQKTRGLSYARLVKLCQVLLKIGKMLGKTFEKAKEQDIKNLVHYYESGEYSFWTKHDIKAILKQFYAWLNKGTYPAKVAWINTTIPKKEKRLVNHKELLTQEEITKLIDTASHPRDKALISVLSESGARIGEIATLHIKHVDIDTNGIVLNLDGKTGHRRIRLVTSTPHLITWLNNHPDKTNPNAPVWVSIGAINYHKSLSYESIRKNIQILFKKTNINKKCYPYIFRHTRACQLAHHFTEFQMNAYFGWVQGSEMPSTYIHISGKDLDEHILRINGMKPGETPVYSKPQNRVCPRCENINSPTALYCQKCAEIVDPNLALKTQFEKPVQKVKTPFLEWLQNDPEMRNVLKKKAEEFRTVT